MARWRHFRWMAAALALGVAVCEIAGWPFLRQPLQDAVTRGTGVAVALQGRFRVHLLWRPHLDVEQLRIAAVDGFQVPYLLDAQGVGVAWRWADLWHWRQGGALRVQSLQAQALKAHLVRAADGRATWQLGTAPSAPKQPDASPQALPGLPRLGSLTVDNGHIVVRDRLLDVDMDVKVRGREGEAVKEGAAGYEASLTGRYRALPLKLEVRAGSTLPLLQDPQSAAAPPSPWVSLRVEGAMGDSRMLFDGRAAALLGGAARLAGALRFTGPSLAQVGEPLGITLPQTPPFDLHGELMHDADVWRLKANRATIGSSRLAGDLRYDGGVHPPRLSGNVTGPKLAFADLGPAIGASKNAPKSGPAARVEEKVLPQRRFDIPSLRAMDADVHFAIDELDFGTPAMAPLRQLRTRVLLQAGVLRLEALQAGVAGGQVKGLTQLDGRAEPARWQADLQFAGIDVAGWLRGLRSDEGSPSAPRATQPAALKKERQQARQGGDQPVRSYLTGSLDGDMRVRGAGRSTAEILGSLDGSILLTLRDGSLSHLVTELLGVDIAQALGVLIRGDHPLPLRCAKLDLAARDGLVQPRLAVIDNRDSTVWITGQVNLRDESLALRAVTRPKDWSPLSLRSPITVTGSLGAPQLGIEGKRLAGRLLGAIALGAAAGPAAALLPLVERGEGRGNDPCRQQAAAPANGASGGASAPATPGTAKKPERAAS